MAMNRGGVTAVCKKCGKTVLASDFVLDSYIGMMVCTNCSRSRKDAVNNTKKQSEEQKKREEEIKSKPPGWDADDEYLERAAKQRPAATKPLVEKIDANHAKYTCPGCKYGFKYNLETKTPSSCPYCGLPLSSMKVR